MQLSGSVSTVTSKPSQSVYTTSLVSRVESKKERLILI
jgi:hypothetical protein